MEGTQLKEIRVADTYSVYIGENILSMAGKAAVKAAKTRKALIVTDDNIPCIYADKVKHSLLQEGFEVCVFTFPHGERSKNAKTYIELLNFAASERLCRSDIMLALGGGVTGDLTGFAAATYMRGINYIQIPTSLLAAVDSSVGAKTAIDLDAGKNLAGAFYRPSAVICDISVLKTLPDEFIRDGMAEVIKYAHIREAELYDILQNTQSIVQSIKDGSNTDKISDIIYRCVNLKAQIVNADEFEAGERALLNFGHTAGHAIEALSEFTVSHGHAVAIGMCIFAKGAFKYGLCDKAVVDGIIALNQKYSLPTETDFDADRIYDICLSDKKNAGNTIKVVLPDGRASCTIRNMTHSELYDFIKAGLEK